MSFQYEQTVLFAYALPRRASRVSIIDFAPFWGAWKGVKGGNGLGQSGVVKTTH